ncbi:MAG: Bax inhibitor-1/YccA family protein [Gammaproteobacteria bacterium]|nr:Bax inhibitor-1/YccA family protein [Gammaproteobacteria bacterium]
MSYIDINSGQVIAHSDGDTRQKFIRKTYIHLAAAIGIFALLEAVMIKMGLHIKAIQLLSSIGQFGWLGVLLVFGFASSTMQRWAQNSIALEKQYMAWGAGIVLEALIFLPMIAMALMMSGEVDILQQASIVTLALVAGLTAVVFTTGKDFSFLRPMLTIGFFVAIGVIVMATIFGFSLGVFFSAAMIVFAAAAILYETSQIQHHYHESQYVGASLSLFSSVGMLFWYVLQFMMSFLGDD